MPFNGFFLIFEAVTLGHHTNALCPHAFMYANLEMSCMEITLCKILCTIFIQLTISSFMTEHMMLRGILCFCACVHILHCNEDTINSSKHENIVTLSMYDSNTRAYCITT